MSVINQMLKELDQRKAATTVGLDASLPYAKPQESKNNRLLLILLGVIAILLIFVIYILKFPVTNGGDSSGIYDTADMPATPVIDNSSNSNSRNFNSRNNASKSLNTEPTQTVQQQVTDHQAAKVPAQEPSLAVNEAAVMPEPSQTLIQKIDQDKQIIADTEVVEISEAVTSDNQQRIIKSNRQIDKKAQAERLYRSAREKIQARQNSEAVGLLEQALHNSDELHKARILLFTMLLQQQQISSLQPRLENSITQWPAIHEYRQMKARLLSSQSDNEAALRLLESDIPAVSKAPEYHELLAYIAQQLKNDPVAIKHYQMLLQQSPNRADWWLGVAVSEDRLGNKQPALQAFQQAIDKQGLSSTVQAYAQKRIKALQGF